MVMMFKVFVFKLLVICLVSVSCYNYECSYPYLDTQDPAYNYNKVFVYIEAINKTITYLSKQTVMDANVEIQILLSLGSLLRTANDMVDIAPLNLYESILNLIRRLSEVRDQSEFVYNSADVENDDCLLNLLHTGDAALRSDSTCNYDVECFKLVTLSKTQGKATVYHLIFLLLARVFGCGEPNVIKVSIENGCRRVYSEMLLVEKWNFPETLVDTFTSQLSICSLLGFGEMMKPRWMNALLSWQSKDGVFYVKRSSPVQNNIGNNIFFNKELRTSYEETKLFDTAKKNEAQKILNRKTNITHNVLGIREEFSLMTFNDVSRKKEIRKRDAKRLDTKVKLKMSQLASQILCTFTSHIRALIEYNI